MKISFDCDKKIEEFKSICDLDDISFPNDCFVIVSDSSVGLIPYSEVKYVRYYQIGTIGGNVRPALKVLVSGGIYQNIYDSPLEKFKDYIRWRAQNSRRSVANEN